MILSISSHFGFRDVQFYNSPRVINVIAIQSKTLLRNHSNLNTLRMALARIEFGSREDLKSSAYFRECCIGIVVGSSITQHQEGLPRF
jgi:hypothetical protein